MLYRHGTALGRRVRSAFPKPIDQPVIHQTPFRNRIDMHLKELKKKTAAELVEMAEELEIEGASTMRRQDLMFAILKEVAEDGEAHEHASRESSRRSRKGNRDREPRHANGRHHGAPSQAQRTPSMQQRGEARRAPREADPEPADHSHLPAFLLRPIRARV